MSTPVQSLKVISVIDFRADLVTVTSDRALPPGSRVSLAVPSSSRAELGALGGKIVGVERATDESFTIRVRLHNLAKETRSKLAVLISLRPAPPEP